ncbi:hypothetical protein OF83DRAFT_1022644, partial [Amylostereum chailletii]
IQQLQATPSFLVGSAVGIAGASLRLWCYRVLGRLFTFEMSIRSGHKLVTTGPYAYARHPSYTGLVMTVAGETLVQLSAGSWLRVFDLLDTPYAKAYLFMLAVPMSLISYSATGPRLEREERALKERFGDEWQAWARKTPYKLIPLLY